MKKIILLIAFVAAPILSQGQSLFDKLEDMDGVTSVVVTKDAFEILSKFNPDNLKGNDAMEVFSMINELKELKVFTTDDNAIANTMEGMVKSAVKRSKLTELMRVKEDDSRVKIYVKSGKNKDYVSEVLMFVRGINKKTKENVDSVIVSLTGTIDINKISKLADTYTKKNGVKVKVNRD
ncbi:uncharacterized protein DUF4252 [Lutibacter sp. Hel_I_33_5]|uniref:DUF4252 domain-containing protein n=1 Tax=Lutibacter sp. Hel_I_33_5 TaxID=1566289 RepID=UPI0011A40E37|nr:DUF4252 domain-containing protein [Lutibacter sp. Hel_I_33_5]TVZ54929.1 uncharacterized protein DUF4252 [Lutibacter sp. Hel_I_33_5]